MVKTLPTGSVRYGESVEVTLTVTNLSGVPQTVWVRDADTAGLAYDGTGVAVDGIADATRDIRTGVDLGVLGVGQAVTVQYNAIAQCYGVHCSSAVAWTAAAYGATGGRAESNRACLAVCV